METETIVGLFAIVGALWWYLRSGNNSRDSTESDRSLPSNSIVEPTTSGEVERNNITRLFDSDLKYAVSQPEGRFIREWDCHWVFDLHGDSVPRARDELERILQQATVARLKSVDIIAGRGNHSRDGIPRIKNMVEQYLEENRYRRKWVNPGMVRVFLRNN